MNETYLQSLIRRFRYHKLGVLSFWIVVVIVVVALFAPLIVPYEPTQITAQFNAPPSSAHWLGTDQIGRDVFSRLLYGTRVSLFVGFTATLISTVVGAVLGLLAGYFGGWIDMVIMRFTDMIMSFPYIMLILVAGTIFKPGMWSITLILGLVDWPGAARLVRGNVLSLKEKDFIKSARISGMGNSFILFREILPNVVAPLLIFSSSVMALSILDEAALSFLGMGVQDPSASLGNMLTGCESLTVLTSKPWLWLSPGLMIVVLVVCTNFIGDALRDALDPTTTMIEGEAHDQ